MRKKEKTKKKRSSCLNLPGPETALKVMLLFILVCTLPCGYTCPEAAFFICGIACVLLGTKAAFIVRQVLFMHWELSVAASYERFSARVSRSLFSAQIIFLLGRFSAQILFPRYDLLASLLQLFITILICLFMRYIRFSYRVFAEEEGHLD